MTYADLDINQRINTKAALQEWARYAVDHFQDDLNKKVYGDRVSKKGVQRSALGKNYRFGSGHSRTNNLRKTWYQNVSDGQGIDRVMIQFLLYGRFLDMGVGRGVSATDRSVSRQLKIGAVGRQRKAWYAKRKGFETHRLREILAQKQMNLAVELIDSAFNIAVTLNL